MNSTITPTLTITAEATLRKAPLDLTLASAVVEIGEDTIPGFRVMRGEYCDHVAYPTGEMLLAKYTFAQIREMADVVLVSYNAIRKVVAA